MLCGVYIFHIFRKDAVNVYLSNPITCLNRNFSLVRMSIGLDRFHCTSHVFVYRLRRLTRFPPYSVTMRVFFTFLCNRARFPPYGVTMRVFYSRFCIVLDFLFMARFPPYWVTIRVFHKFTCIV